MATKNKQARWLHPVRVLLMAVLLAVMAIVVWIMPLRPTHSAVENRDLAKFPQLTAEALFSGTYFDDINTWFADTFPAREALVSAGANIKSLFGLRGEGIVQSEQYGEADDIAPLPPAATTTTGNGTTDVNASSAATTTTTYSGPKWEANDELKNQSQALDSILVKGDTAFEYYHFNQEVADGYIQTIARAGSLLGDIKTYSLIVPTSMEVMLPKDQHPDGVSSQSDALDYLTAWISHNNPAVNVVDARATLMAHNSEYIYFHTDHHWTALGAYYAYTEFAKAAGIEPAKLDEDFELQIFDNFRGSFYSTAQEAGLSLSSDTVYAYDPLGEVSMTYTDTEGNTIPYPVICDVTDWSARYKYNCFIAGDQPLVTITNESIEDDSSIILVKESYGNAFAPFLAATYRNVYVVDLRYFNDVYEQDLPTFAKEKGVDAVLFLNNISATRNGYLVSCLSDLVG